MANKRGRQETCEDSSAFYSTQLHKMQPGPKLHEISQIVLKISTHQTFWYQGLDASLNALQFGGDVAFLIGEIC